MTTISQKSHASETCKNPKKLLRYSGFKVFKMEIKKLEEKNGSIKYQVILSEKLQGEYEKKATEMLSKEVSIKGFRKGHVPKKMLIEKFGEEFFYGYMQDKFINNIYAELIKESKVTPISSPDFKSTSNNPLTIEFTIPTTPEIDLQKVEKVKLTLTKPKATKKEVDEAIEKELEIQTTYNKTEEKAANKDRLIIDFEGFDKDGKTIENTKAEKQFLVLGSNKFIPGFEDELIGSKAGEKVEFDITFPKDYHAENMKGAKVKFVCHVHSVEKPETPELNEETIEKILGEKMSKADFEKKTKEMILDRKLIEEKRKLEAELIDKIVEATDVEILDVVLNQQLMGQHKELVRNLEAKKQKLEDFVANFEKETGKKFMDEQKSQAEKQIKLRFALDALTKKHKLEVTEEDYEKRIEAEVAKAPKLIQEHLKNYYAKGTQGEMMLKNQIFLDKIFDLFVEQK